MSDLLDAMKMAGMGAVDNAGPVRVMFGVVASAAPLSVRVDQKLILPEQALILTDAVRDHEKSITISGITDSSGDSISTTTTITVHNALNVGESVILIRVQGGQKYLIIGKGAAS